MRQEILLIFVLMMLSPVAFYFVVDKKDDSDLVGQRKKNEARSSVAEDHGSVVGSEAGASFEIEYSSARLNQQTMRQALESEVGLAVEDSSSSPQTGLGLEEPEAEAVETKTDIEWVSLYSKWELNLLDAAGGTGGIQDFGSNETCSIFFVQEGITRAFTNLASVTLSQRNESITLKTSSVSVELSGLSEPSALLRATRSLVSFCEANT
jgi:hypothetical protein